MGLSSLSVVLPCHNEAGNIAATLKSVLYTASLVADRIEVIVVDDGSSDNSAQIVEATAQSDPRVHIVRHTSNQGYGAALRSGFRHARGEYVFFTDSDGQFELAELQDVLPLLDRADMVVGYRRRRADRWFRLFLGRFFSYLVDLLFQTRVRDINCAFKLFPRSLVESDPFLSEGALISTEIISRARRKGLRIEELPVRHSARQYGEQSGASLRVIARALVELVSLRLRLREEFRVKGVESRGSRLGTRDPGLIPRLKTKI